MTKVREGKASPGELFAFLAAWLASPVLYGLAIERLWNWFVPLTPIAFGQALGVLVLASLLRGSSGIAYSPKSFVTSEDVAKGLGRYFATPLVCLGAGWVLHFVGVTK